MFKDESIKPNLANFKTDNEFQLNHNVKASSVSSGKINSEIDYKNSEFKKISSKPQENYLRQGCFFEFKTLNQNYSASAINNFVGVTTSITNSGDFEKENDNSTEPASKKKKFSKFSKIPISSILNPD
ncbi:hypothetical protein AYI70_g3568 [Smittium culicis]|uniref:Uncharacterized protein n=1 Tax=Smittium culicis TaxID=133412 RepID=A0A1R1Y2T5_9FUNG|nr:hypothetical protein AYI70_g3568 [Smittium culicis]